MLRGHGLEAHAAQVHRLPPVELDGFSTGAPDPFPQAQGHHEGDPALRQLRHAWQIRMIVVIVRQQHEIHRRQRAQRHAWRHGAARTGEGKRTGTLGEHGIGEERHAVHPHQEGRVTDPGETRAPCDRRAVVRDSLYRARPGRQGDLDAATEERQLSDEAEIFRPLGPIGEATIQPRRPTRRGPRRAVAGYRARAGELENKDDGQRAQCQQDPPHLLVSNKTRTDAGGQSRKAGGHM